MVRTECHRDGVWEFELQRFSGGAVGKGDCFPVLVSIGVEIVKWAFKTFVFIFCSTTFTGHPSWFGGVAPALRGGSGFLIRTTVV